MKLNTGDYVIIKDTKNSKIAYSISQETFDRRFKQPVEIHILDFNTFSAHGYYFNFDDVEKVVTPEKDPEYFI